MSLDVYTEPKNIPINVIQGAYLEYCTPADQKAVYVVDWWLVFQSVVPAQQLPQYVSDPSVEGWLKFQQLVTDWQTQRGAMSSTTEAAMCPAYQSIIGMGKAAVSLILKQLKSEGDDPDQWFWALTAITQATPENREDRGNYVKMAASWFEWAKNNGYAW